MPPRSTTSILQLSKPLGYVCPKCRTALFNQQQRSISESYKAKVQEAKEQWQRWRLEIHSGRRESMLSKLESRGLVNDVTGDKKKLDDLLTDKRIGVYCGIDPTAPSLHVGHMAPLMALFWMHIHGFHTVSLIGGGTARVGDPTGRTNDRPEMSSTERKANIVSMHYQVKKLWQNLERIAEKHGYKWEKYWHRELVNNATWWNKVTLVEVLKFMGNGLRLGTMLGRDTVRRKMDSGSGMSFAEFCYPILQAWDWWRMYDEKGVQMQIGGADQYGNIMAGMDAVKYVAKTHPDPDTRKEATVDGLDAPVGLTVPLLTTASGDKFGKSAGNAVWLDQSMTSLFDLYAYWVGTSDADVERYLKLFTFLPLSEIQQLMEAHEKDRSKRKPQETLAYEFIELIHGKENAAKARKQYLERAEQRKTTNLSALMSSAVDTDAESDYDWKPQAPPTTDQLIEPPPDNPFDHNQNAATRELGRFVSQKLNKFAPVSSPNNVSGGPARVVLPASLVKNTSIARVLHSAGLVTSRSEGHRLTIARGAYYGRRSSNKEQMSDDLSFHPAGIGNVDAAWNNIIRDHESGAMDKEGEEGLLILRSGKWKVRVVRVVSDELFETLHLPDPPGWAEHKSLLAAERAGNTIDDDATVETGDVDFEEPGKFIPRKEAEKNRRQQRQEAAAYFHNEAVRRQLLRTQLKRPTGSGRHQSKAYTDSSDDTIDAATRSEEAIVNATDRRSPGRRSSVSPERQARLKQVKQRMLRRAHRDGSGRAMQTRRAEQKSQRDAEDERMSSMRRAQEERRRQGLRGLRRPIELPAPPAAPVPTPAEIASRREAQRKEEMRAKQMEVAKARRNRERDRLVGGMVERGWWKDSDESTMVSASGR